MKGPGYIRRNEEIVYQMVLNGCLEIDEEGRIWRVGVVVHGKVYRTKRRRAERREDDSPYLKLQITIGGRQYKCMAHRLVYLHFYGPIPQGAEINHKEGCHEDNRPEMLEAVSHGENVLHSYRETKTQCRKGTNNPRCRLSEESVRAIRTALRTDRNIDVARKFDIHPSTVHSIKIGKTWNHLKGD
jgi:hypothetical protein